MSATIPEAYVGLAGRLADASGAVIRRYFRSTVEIDEKPDATPVTNADREAESAIREIIAAECSDHGVLGEEHGSQRVDAEFLWVIDPIDGTKSFISGVPLFGTLIALLHEGRPVVGIIDQPVLGERWLGVTGRQTVLNGKPISTRACTGLAEAILTSTTPDLFEASKTAAADRLRDIVKMTRYGYDCYGYGMLSLGYIDIVVEAELAPYDYCALVPVVEGSGGLITDWDGHGLDLESDGLMCASGDARVHRAALDILRG